MCIPLPGFLLDPCEWLCRNALSLPLTPVEWPILWLEVTCFCSSPKAGKDELNEVCYVPLAFGPESLHLKDITFVDISTGYIWP